MAVSKDDRLDGIVKELGMTENCLCHVTDIELDKRIQTALSNILRDRTAAVEAIRCQVSVYRERLRGMGVFLKDYMEKRCPDEGCIWRDWSGWVF